MYFAMAVFPVPAYSGRSRGRRLGRAPRRYLSFTVRLTGRRCVISVQPHVRCLESGFLDAFHLPLGQRAAHVLTKLVL